MTKLYENEYPDGTQVCVSDTGRNRKYRGKVLYLVRLNDNNQADAWMVELNNGNRGCYDRDHISAV